MSGCALLLAGIAEQVLDQRGNDEDDDNPDGNLHEYIPEEG
jgi:hypothetical protein